MPRQTQADDYTSYELLAPERQQFRILYDVTATTAGATVFLNPIRQGSEASDERVIDLATGRPLPFKVDRRDARHAASGCPTAPADAEYLRIDLARPVPAGGEQRIRIDKTYKDPASYTRDGDRHRLCPITRHPSQQDRPAARLRARLVQHAGRRFRPKTTGGSR